MKKILFGLLSASLFIATPAIASHHEGGHDKKMSDPEFTAKHNAMMNTQIAHLKTTQEHGLEMMKTGNEMLRKGKDKKNGKLMLAGAKILKIGHHMHEESMHELMDVTESMKHHLMHAKVGDMQMTDTEMDTLKKDMDQIKSGISAYKNTCHAEVAKMPESAAMLVDMGDQLIKEALKEANADKAELGTELISMGMKMMGNKEHHKSTNKMEVRIEKEVRMMH